MFKYAISHSTFHWIIRMQFLIFVDDCEIHIVYGNWSGRKVQVDETQWYVPTKQWQIIDMNATIPSTKPFITSFEGVESCIGVKLWYFKPLDPQESNLGLERIKT